MTVKLQTSSDNRKFDSEILDKIVICTFENSKNCKEIFEIIRERLLSKRSTIKNLIKVLNSIFN